jgi:hypothetical protein
LSQALPQAVIHRPALPPVLGALLLAFREGACPLSPAAIQQLRQAVPRLNLAK